MSKLHEEYAKIAHPEWLDELAEASDGDDLHPVDIARSTTYLDSAYAAWRTYSNEGDKVVSAEAFLVLHDITCADGKVRKLYTVADDCEPLLTTEDYAEAIAVWKLEQAKFWKKHWNSRATFDDTMPLEVVELRRKHGIDS